MPLTPLPIDSQRLELGRLARLRQALAATDHAGAVFFDPTNIRYATGTSNMQVYGLHSACRYVFVPTDGPVILFEFAGCELLPRVARPTARYGPRSPSTISSPVCALPKRWRNGRLRSPIS
jgi:Xaa-Pro aminopeptidase